MPTYSGLRIVFHFNARMQVRINCVFRIDLVSVGVVNDLVNILLGSYLFSRDGLEKEIGKDQWNSENMQTAEARK